ncbi:group II intron reverse transcriptase/maturase [Magnetovirga frankeli]|uniref:group II intron reverse transcriptase/maturase n=1 Tax=Magnetovirga frankeli TaxID=947516 RepID=UPI003D3592BB
MTETQSSGQAEAGLGRLRAAAQRDRTLRFNNLMHHIGIDRLRKAYLALNRKAARGVDGLSWKAYGEGLEARLVDLHARLHSGRYRPQPVQRVWIPKADGRKRPLGITAVEDKLVQQALVGVLETIYEVDFKGFSYGFRPGRSQHHALDALYVAITQRKVSWILDTDISTFFDSVDHDWLMRFVSHRVADRRVLRLIEQMLTAGIMEEGEWQLSEQGTPQGGVLSPLLANIYLHYSLDLWVEAWRKRRARGEVYIVRYADDAVLGFQYHDDAQRLRQDLTERLRRFNLQLHPEKTRLVEFGRFAEANRKQRGQGKPETFAFLGFTHACAKRRSDGGFTILRTTLAKKLRGFVERLKDWLLKNRHLPVAEQGRMVSQKLRGFALYFGVPGNSGVLSTVRGLAIKIWFRALRRRSQKAVSLNWEKMKKIVHQWVPSLRIVHPYPNERLRV